MGCQQKQLPFSNSSVGPTKQPLPSSVPNARMRPTRNPMEKPTGHCGMHNQGTDRCQPLRSLGSRQALPARWFLDGYPLLPSLVRDNRSLVCGLADILTFGRWPCCWFATGAPRYVCQGPHRPILFLTSLGRCANSTRPYTSPQHRCNLVGLSFASPDTHPNPPPSFGYLEPLP